MALTPIHKLLQRGQLAYGRLTRGMTLGVRALLLKDGQVLLVKHSYVPGWYLPGGGVELGESFAEALAREIREEAGAELDTPGELFALYRNGNADARDHVALFVCREWEQRHRVRIPNHEIIALRLFALDALPDDATPATAARIAEVLGGREPATDW